MDNEIIILNPKQHISTSDKQRDMTWSDLNEALIDAFGVKSYETLIAIEVSKTGIIAKIGLIKDDGEQC